MSIVRTVHNKENPFTMINKKALWDKDLSLEAVGLWARLLSRPNNWEISVKELCKSCACGRDKIRTLLNELEKSGYAYRYQTRKTEKQNQFGKYDTFIFEEKISPEEIKKMFTETENPSPSLLPQENPSEIKKMFTETPFTAPENPPPTNTNLTKTKKLSCADSPLVAVSPALKIDKVDCQGKKFTLSKDELFMTCVNKWNDWTEEEFDELWKIIEKYSKPIRNLMLFCEAAIKNMRKSNNLKKLRDTKCSNKENKKPSKTSQENTKKTTSPRDTWGLHLVNWRSDISNRIESRTT